MTVAVWFLYEFGDIVDCCWVTFADYHFFTQLFYMFMWEDGEIFRIQIFSPSEIVRSIIIWGIFRNSKNTPNQLAIYILLLGRKSQTKRISPTHILYIIHRYTKYAT